VNNSKYFHYNKNSELEWNGKKINSFLKNYDQPLFIYNLDILKERLYFFKQNLTTNGQAFFAVKSNNNSEVLQCIYENDFGFDVVSKWEIEKLLSLKIPASKIIFSGVAKTKEEIAFAISNNIHCLNVESIEELKRVIQIANQLNKSINISLRLNPDIEVKTHPYIATGFREHKFGISMEQAHQAIELLKHYPLTSLKGLSFHLGSQLFDSKVYTDALDKLQPLLKSLTSLEFIDIGGGFGINYENDSDAAEYEIVEKTLKICQANLSKLNLKLYCEPGRWLVARAGALMCQVQYVKDNGYKKFVLVDSGMNHLMRPTLYEAFHEIIPFYKRSIETEIYDIVGPICESSDFFAKDRKIYQIEADDFLIIKDVGAYGYTMSNNYNLRPLANEVILR